MFMSNSKKRTIKEKVVSTFEGKEGQVFRRREIIEMVLKKFPDTNDTSVIPSDYCYNITNNGIKFNFHLFEYLERDTYKFLGAGAIYNGLVSWNGSEYGKWTNGKFKKL